MASRQAYRLHPAFGAGVVGVIAVGLASFAPTTVGRGSAGPAPAVEVEGVAVRRMDLDTSLLAGGDLVAVKQTAVTCEVEDLDGMGDIGTLILSIVPNGATVKRGDVLCVLDSSAFDEVLRLERIETENARGDHRQAELTLETAGVALREYREGIVGRRSKEYESRSALLRADVERQRDYVAWAGRMLDKGYFARAPVAGARQELDRLSHQLAVVEEEARVYRQFTAPKETRELESQVEGARATFEYQCARRQAHEERLAMLLKQAGKYTLRAPHDGMVVYPPVFEWMRRPLQPGVEVYQHEDILFLPDLSQIEVEVPFHETVEARVRVGMPAEVHITALPGRRFTGKVASIEMLPRTNFKGWDWTLQFFARIRLDRTPPGLLPFMSAEVRVDTGRIEDALVIPSGAMAVVDHRKCCYVLGPAGPERREIAIGRSTPEFVEVTAGLREGERVVLNPGRDVPRGTL